MHLQVTTESAGPATVVTAAGELDLHTAPELDTALKAATDAQAPVLVVDLVGIDFMDSTGLSVIIAAVAAARAYGGEVRVATAAEKVTKVFTLTGVDQQVAMFGSRQEALWA
jgi:anti-sigma B factor antagonist